MLHAPKCAMFHTVRLCCFDTHCILGVIQNVLWIVRTIASTIFQKCDKSKSSRVIHSSHYEERKISGNSPILLEVTHMTLDLMEVLYVGEWHMGDAPLGGWQSRTNSKDSFNWWSIEGWSLFNCWKNHKVKSAYYGGILRCFMLLGQI